MKKAIKYISIGLLVVLLGVGGWMYYLFNVKDYATEDAEVSKVVDSEYKLDMPNLKEAQASSSDPGNQEGSNDSQEQETSSETKDKASKDPSVSSSSNGEATSTTDNEASSSPNVSNDGTSHQSNELSSSNSNGDQSSSASQVNENTDQGNDSNDQAGTQEPSTDSSSVTKAQIKQSYRPAFESLQSQATSKLNSLMASAMSEYQQKKSNGQNISYAYFYQKYYGAAKDVEANTDQAFNQLYSALQADLKANGHSPSAAQEFKQAYEEAKSARKSNLLAKAKSAMN